MGCDIHMYAETRNEDGTWSKVGNVFDNPYYDAAYVDEYGWNVPKIDEPYSDRNYALFAILANVRNGYGFAGVVTHEPVNPLFAGRGVPEDASAEYRGIVADWNYDGHSHTYATLAELKSVNWDNIVINQTGFLSETDYNRVLTTGTNPERWCGDVSGENIRKVTAAAYENQYRNAVASTNDKVQVYIQWFWQETMTKRLGIFITETIPALENLGSPEDVRIVFFFDN